MRRTPCAPLPLCPQGPKGLQVSTWQEALGAAAAALTSAAPSEVRGIAGKLADAESMVALMDLLRGLGAGDLAHEGGFADMPADVRSTYTANTTVQGLEQVRTRGERGLEPAQWWKG